MNAEGLTMDDYKGHPREDVCHLLQSVILQICEEHYQACGDVEVDAIICLSTLNSDSQDVVKIHKVLPSCNFKNRHKRTANIPLEQIAKFRHSKRQKFLRKHHHRSSSFVPRFPRQQDYIPIYASNEFDQDAEAILSTHSQVKEEDMELNSLQNTNSGSSDRDEFKSEAGEEPNGLDTSTDHHNNLMSSEMDQNSFISQQDEKSAIPEAIYVCKEEPCEKLDTDPPNYSSRPKRKQNPKRIVHLQDMQNEFEKDISCLENDTGVCFPHSNVNERNSLDQKQFTLDEDSGDTDEFQAMYTSGHKPVHSYAETEVEGDGTAETDSIFQETEEIDPLEVSESPTTEKVSVSKHRNKKISPNLLHNKSKVFRCSKCGSGFSSKKSQMRHERYNCGDIPHFECNVCGKFYSRADSKTRHLWKIHGIKISTPDKNNPLEFP
ncbi:zinc finger protein 37-like [Saccostrea echinata]|uniref:zinc finger protein 37-like n=1 Tax=Saccostrea echinata TaxID=191078 RepID=UPI002A7EFFF5|nr:zinc finger protein 37-like [Saccostrea echinata]